MIRDPYKKLAKYYDTFVEPFNTVLRKIVLKMYPPKEGMRVLEVGCGTGTKRMGVGPQEYLDIIDNTFKICVK